MGMTTTSITIAPRPSPATVVDGTVWGAPRHRHLQASGNDAYDMGGPLPICWCVHRTNRSKI